MEIKVDIQTTAKDLQQAYQVHYLKLYPIRSNLLLIFAAIGLLLAMLPYMSIQFRLFVLFYAIAMAIFHFWRYYNIGAKVFKRNPSIGLPASFVITEDSMQYSSEGATGELKWERYVQAIITNNLVMLYPGKDSFVVFHSRFFKGDDFNSFKEIVKHKIKVIV